MFIILFVYYLIYSYNSHYSVLVIFIEEEVYSNISLFFNLFILDNFWFRRNDVNISLLGAFANSIGNLAEKSIDVGLLKSVCKHLWP